MSRVVDLEPLVAPIAGGQAGFTVEKPVTLLVPDLGNVAGQLKAPSSTFSIEHTRERWYKDFFYKQDHGLYVGQHAELGPLVLALQREKIMNDHDKLEVEQFRAIIFTKKGSLYCAIPYTKAKGVSLFTQISKASGLDEAALNNLSTVKVNMREKLSNEILQIENMDRPDRLIMGVVYGKDQQKTLDDMYKNEDGSPQFEVFLDSLGDRVDLRQRNDDELMRFAGFGGIKTESDGPAYVYMTTYANYEVILHVSTLLPYDENDPQQLGRKRKIGNDIGVLVFNESSVSFEPQLQSSKVNHVISVIKVEPPREGLTRYSFSTASKDEVPAFGPMIKSTEFSDPRTLRDFIITKMINGNHAAFHHAPGFRREDTLRQLLDDIVARYSVRDSKWFGGWSKSHQKQRSVFLTNDSLGKGVCSFCKKPVSDRDGVSAMNQTFHTECFICSHCMKPFGNEPFIVHPKTGKPYCEEDFTQQFCPRCEKCNGDLDYFIRALGKAWHLAHFCCSECDQPIGEDPFFEREGKPYCVRDYHKIFGVTCSKCKNPIVGSCIDFMGGKYHPECHQCVSCSKPIQGNSVFAFDAPWHPACFVCTVCKKSFGPGVGYYGFENKPYCEQHFHDHSGTICCKCNQPVTSGSMCRMGQKVFHAEHFQCSRCQAVIGNEDRYAVMDDEPICMACVQKEIGDDEGADL